MRLFFICLIFIAAQQTASAQVMKGTYSYGKPKKGPYGVLQIHQIKPGNFLFYLEVGKDAPNYNSGALYDKITFNKTSGRYEANTKSCRLQFLNGPKGVTVTTVKGDCGFGYGVIADGTYLTENHRNPSWLKTRTGKKLYFAKTTPATFKED